MSKQQTAEFRAWRAQDAQERIDRAIAALRYAQCCLHMSRIHHMPRSLVLSDERMVGLRLDALWAVQQGAKQLKLVESVI